MSGALAHGNYGVVRMNEFLDGLSELFMMLLKPLAILMWIAAIGMMVLFVDAYIWRFLG